METKWFKLIFSVCSTCIMGAIAANMLRLNTGAVIAFSLSLLFTLYTHKISDNRKKVILFLLFPISIFLSATGIGLIFRAGFAVWLVNSAYNSFIWILGYLTGIAAYNNSFAFITSVLLMAIIAPVTYILMVGDRHIGLLTFNTIILVILWATFNSNIHVIYIIGYCLLSVFLIMDNVRLNRRKFDNQDYHDGYVYLQWILPLCVLISIISISIPARPRPLEWKWLDNILFPPPNYHVSQLDPFNIGKVGYGNEDSLGGQANPTDDVALVVKAERPLYLKALTKDKYTGAKWENSDTSAYILDSEKSSITAYINEWQEAKILRRINELGNIKMDINIRYENISTKNLFYPVMFQNIKAGKTKLLWADSGGGIMTMFKHSTGFSYNVTSDIVDYASDSFKNILKQAGNLPSGNSPSGNLPSGNSSNSPGENTRSNYNIALRYLVLPDKLPQRITNLALYITSDAETYYDKVVAVEDYLGSNFIYTLEPPEIPEGSDFVDHFLFEGRSGYCTYFASAMTVLLRCAGIPARYVEGYAMPEEASSKNTYIVTNKEAHAWTEVYFEGIGWIPFEPTPPYRSRLYWQDTVSAGAKPPPSGSWYTDYNFDDFDYDTGEYEDLDEALFIKKVLRILYILIIAALVLGLIISILVRWNRYRRARFRDDLRRKVPAKSCVELFMYYMRILSLCGYTRKFNETVHEFTERIEIDGLEMGNLEIDGLGMDGVEIDSPEIDNLEISSNKIDGLKIGSNKIDGLRMKALGNVFDKARYGNGKMEVWETRLMLESYDDFMTVSVKLLGKVKAFVLGDIIGLF